MALTDRLTTAKSELEFYLDSVRGAKLEQHQIDRLLTLNGLLGVNAGTVTSSVVFASPQAVTQSGTWNVGITGFLSLPTNANTSALQTTGNTSLITIQPPTTYLVSTVCLVAALIESSTITFTNVKKLAIESRTNTSFRLSTISGDTINTQNFEAVLTGREYYQDGINFTGNFFFSAEALPTPIIVLACAITNGSANVTSANSFSSAVIGQAVTGTGIPASIFVIRRAADGLSITLGNAAGATVNATATASVSLTFSGAVIRIARWT